MVHQGHGQGPGEEGRQAQPQRGLWPLSPEWTGAPGADNPFQAASGLGLQWPAVCLSS